MKPNSQFFFFLMDNALDIVFRKSLWNTRSSRYSILFSRSFIALHFTFRSVLHFEFFFVKGIRSVSTFGGDYHSNYSNPICWKVSFLYGITFASLSKISWLYMGGSFPGCSILFQWSNVYFLSSAQYCPDLCTSVEFWGRVMCVLQLYSPSTVLCWLFWGFLHFHNIVFI